jgi:DNA-binding transcriptional MerR regulator
MRASPTLLPAGWKIGSMRIGELGDRTGVSAKAIRYYESIGLVPAPPRTASGYRDYGEGDEARLVFIKTAQHLGLSLDEIREVLALREAGSTPCDHVRQMLRNQVRTISQRIKELRRLQEELRALDAVIDEIPEGEAAVCRIIEQARRASEHPTAARPAPADPRHG